MSRSLLIFKAPEYIWSQNSIALKSNVTNTGAPSGVYHLLWRALPGCSVQSDLTRCTEQFSALCINFFPLVHISVPACRAPSAPGAAPSTTSSECGSTAAAPLSCTHWQVLRNRTQVKLLQKKPQDKTLVQTDSKIFSFGKSRLAAQHGYRTREAVRQGRCFLTQARGGLWNSTSIPSWGEKPDQRYSNCNFWRWLIEARFPVAPIYFLWSFKDISAHLPGEQSWGV